MAVSASIYASILGGVIAGLVGLSATYYSRYLDRKDRHFKDHKENLRIINKAIAELINAVWPFQYGAEELKLGNPKYINYGHSTRLSLLETQMAVPIPDENSVNVMMIDRILFRDMKRHFKTMSKSLEDFESMVRTKGVEVTTLLYEISTRIYYSMYQSELEVLEWTYDRGVKTHFKNLTGRLEEQDYAGIIFLFLLREDELEWPNRTASLKKYDLYNGLKRLSDEIRIGIEDKISDMQSLLDELKKQRKICEDEIDEELRHNRLKGRCDYI